MDQALDLTNLTAAMLNFVVAGLFFQLSRSDGRNTTMSVILAVFFSLRAVDRLASGGNSLVPYSKPVDLAINVLLIGALIALALNARSYIHGVNSSIGEARALANRDSLTGLLNRRGWEQRLAAAHAAPHADTSVPGHAPLFVALLDLDHFKSFNDEYGHVAGDEVIKAAAHGWEAFVREGDSFGRYGGEEFIAILPDCDTATAVQIGHALRTATPFGQTCSVGIARWNGHESTEALIARADSALYRAKEAGRDRVVLDGNLEAITSLEHDAA